MKSENSKEGKMESTSKKTIKKVIASKIKHLEGRFFHVKVGNENTPATTEEINSIQDKLVELFEKNDVNCLAFVTHHAVSVEII